MKRSAAFWLAGLLVVFMSVSGASAAWFDADFPSSISTVSGVAFFDGNKLGPFDAVGDMVEQTFTNTGLESAVGLNLLPVLTSYTLGAGDFIVMDVFVNGVLVDSDLGNNPLWVIRPEGTGPKKLAFVFHDIIGHGTYTITLKVNRLTPGASMVLGYPTRMELVGCPAPAAPIPALSHWGMLIFALFLGLSAIYGLSKRRAVRYE